MILDFGFTSVEFDIPVALKLDEEDDDKVVMGVGINLVMFDNIGALGLLYRLAFLLSSFFFPSS